MNLNAKYRPSAFEDVVGQNVTVAILNRMLETGKIKNCMAFVGSSGTGKTSCARCFAKAINKGCGSPIQIDAASQNGVDNIRAIVDSANQRSIDSEYKVYIIDEAHMLTTPAWNALLKTIEEPPQYTIFIFCTTEPNKIPATIMNRVQHYNFAKISQDAIYARLCTIANNEGFTNYEAACDFIAKASNGSMRSAITFLEQCACLSTEITIDVAKKVLGELSYERMLRLTNFLISGDCGSILLAVDALYNQGVDLRAFIDNYLTFTIETSKYIIFRDLSLTSIPRYLEMIQEPSLNIVQTVAFENALAWFNKLADKLLELKLAIKYDASYKSTIEVFLLQICRGL